MYDRNDLKISGNAILVKAYTGIENDGVKHFNWETLLEVNRSRCIYSLRLTMESLIKAFI